MSKDRGSRSKKSLRETVVQSPRTARHREYALSEEGRAYRRRYAKIWRKRNPERAKEISRVAQKKYRVKMKAKGYHIDMIDGKWQWVPRRKKK